MFSVFAARNAHDAIVISVRLDMSPLGDFRHRWNRSTYGWNAMRSQVMTHWDQLEDSFGLDAVCILWWSVEEEISNDWSEHLKAVMVGHSERIDIWSRKALNAAASRTYSERGEILAEFRDSLGRSVTAPVQSKELFPKNEWLELPCSPRNGEVENPEKGE